MKLTIYIDSSRNCVNCRQSAEKAAAELAAFGHEVSAIVARDDDPEAWRRALKAYLGDLADEIAASASPARVDTAAQFVVLENGKAAGLGIFLTWCRNTAKFNTQS